MTTQDILEASGLDRSLIVKMTTAAQLRSVRCPTCNVGAGRNCIDLPIGREVHEARVEAVHAAFPNVLPR